MARKRRKLTAEDTALWNKVAASATPLHRDRIRTHEAGTASPKAAASAHQKQQMHAFRVGEAAKHIEPGHLLAPSVSERINDAPVRMHRGTFQKMQRGKLKPEARIDLHGLTLAQAHPMLTEFILDAYARGLRLVLVITGKGRDREQDGPIPIRRGVLRQQVPAWLYAVPLGAVVLDIRTAHLKHGGEGAYYVYLKRRR